MLYMRCMLDKQGYTHARACTRPRARTHKYVIFIAFPQQQLFRERASMLRYTYIACIVDFAIDLIKRIKV